MTLGRRSLLCRFGALAMSTLATGCRWRPGREQVLSELVAKVIIPSYEELVRRATLLRERAAERTGLPLPPRDPEPVRGAWRETLLALKRTYAFRSGPVDEQALAMRAGYSPIRTESIDQLARAAEADAGGRSGGPALNAESIERAGAAAKGLFALEYLLFDGDRSAGHRLLAGALAEDVERRARAVLRAAQEQDLPRRIGEGGQQALGRLANDPSRPPRPSSTAAWTW